MRTDAIAMIRLIAGGTLCAFALHAAAQDAYPSRPIHLVVPQGPGGGTDLLARQVGETLAKALNVPVLVENKPGGDSNIAAAYVAHEPADGYTLNFANSALLVNHVMGTANGSSYTDLSPLTLIATAPWLLVINSTTPANHIAELVAYSKKNPGVLNHSSTALSTTLLMEHVKRITSVDATNIPYRGGGQGLTALIANETHMMLTSLVPVQPFLASGKLRAVGVAADKRLPAVSQVPTFREQGFDFVSGPWWALFVSAKTPVALLAKMESAMQSARADQRLQDTMVNQGLIAATGDRKVFQKFLDSEAKIWQKIVKN